MQSPPQNSGACKHKHATYEHRPSPFTLARRTIAALAALTVLAFLAPLPPTAQAVTCQPAQRGILNANNTFSRGMMARHNDYRVICRGDGSGREVRREHLENAFDDPDADDVVGGINRFVLQLDNAYLDWEDEDLSRTGDIVLLGTVRGDFGRHGVDIGAWDGLDFWNALNIDSHANIRTTGGGEGLNVYSGGHRRHYYPVRVRNFGSIETTGGGPAHGNRRGRGMDITSNGGAAQAINERGGSVVTRGPGARAVTAGTAGGTATAINRGTITTHGGGFLRGSSLWTSEGLRTWADGPGVVAQSVNERGGVIVTRGAGARGVVATSSSGAGTVSIATNRGRITTRGNRLRLGSQSRWAFGVEAHTVNGISRATNESGATIDTYGTGAGGLSAGNSGYLLPSVGQRAEVENRGRITTRGHQSDDNRRAHAMEAWSEFGTAYAVNHEGATVLTTGRAARGVQASTGDGGPDETAVALNRGTVTTSGNGLHTSTSVSNADGVAAFSAGAASAVAVNAYEGAVEARGAGAKGVWASAYGSGGAAIARNQGHITTRGDAYGADRAGTSEDTWRSATGLAAYSANASATATNEAGGVIETHGAVADGMYAWSDGGGDATAVNRGRITTRGAALGNLPGAAGRQIGARGVQAHSEDAGARVVNDRSGRVDTYGARAFALFAESEADGSRTSTLTEVINRGGAQTRGFNADGAVAIALHGGTAANPNRVRAINAKGATIATAGTGASGLGTGISVSGGGTQNAFGSAFARNDGTVTTGGGAVGNRAGAFAANGVAATFFAPDNTRIGQGGDVTVVNTGDVTVSGAHASALYAETFGRGTATVRVMGGQVRSEHATGRGLWARTGSGGQVDVTIAGGADVAARRNIGAQFQGGTANVRLLDSTITGRVVFFGAGRNTFTLRNARVTGATAFGAGADTLNVHGDAWLERGFSALETLNKRGSGNLVVRGNATFSPGAQAVVENGGLTFTGQFNLGARGAMRIHDSARLTAVLANPSAPPRITAPGGLTFDGDAELFVQVAPGVTLAQERTYLTQSQFRRVNVNPIANGTRVTGRTTGPVALRTARGPSSVIEVGHIPLANGRTQTAGTVVRSGVRLGMFDLDAPANLTDLTPGAGSTTAGLTSSSSPWSGSELIPGGGVAALGAALFGVFDAEETEFARDEPLTMSGFVESRARDEGLEYWARSWSGDAPVLAEGVEATVRGYALGVDTPLGEGFRFGVSAAPALALSSLSYGHRTGASARLDGARYALRGGWHGGGLHAGASLSRGRYEAQSVFDNPVAGGGLAGRYDFTRDHVRLGAGARLGWSGMEITPALSVHAGVLRHGAYTARGPVFHADVPGYAQRYHGWKSELTVAPSQWLRAPQSVRWRPALHLYTQRTRSVGPGVLDVVQHDRAGVVSLRSRARVSELPGTVHGVGVTVDAVRSESWRLRLGVAGMRADGDTDGALRARLHVRF